MALYCSFGEVSCGMITCPECGQEASDDAKFCDRCGQGLSKAAASVSQSPTRPSPLTAGTSLKGGIEIVGLTGQTSIENRYRARRIRDGKTESIALRERLGPQPSAEVVLLLKLRLRRRRSRPLRVPRIPTARAPRPRNSSPRLRRPTGPRRHRNACPSSQGRVGRTHRARLESAVDQRRSRSRFHRDGRGRGEFIHG